MDSAHTHGDSSRRGGGPNARQRPAAIKASRTPNRMSSNDPFVFDPVAHVTCLSAAFLVYRCMPGEPKNLIQSPSIQQVVGPLYKIGTNRTREREIRGLSNLHSTAIKTDRPPLCLRGARPKMLPGAINSIWERSSTARAATLLPTLYLARVLASACHSVG